MLAQLNQREPGDQEEETLATSEMIVYPKKSIFKFFLAKLFDEK